MGLEAGSDGAERGAGRPGDWGQGEFRVLDASLSRLLGLRAAPLPRSWQVPSAPGDAECLGKGDLEGVGVPEGAWDGGWTLGGERLGGIPRVKPRAG